MDTAGYEYFGGFELWPDGNTFLLVDQGAPPH